MEFTMNDIEQVLQIIKDLQGVKDIELHVDLGATKLSVLKGNIVGSSMLAAPVAAQVAAPVAAPVAAAAPAKVAAAAAAAAVPSATHTPAAEFSTEGLVAITAPFTGILYRKPDPNSPAFVEEGDEINDETTVCLVEVMKCFSSVLAGVKGKVEKIMAQNATLVEIGEVLMWVRPS